MHDPSGNRNPVVQTIAGHLTELSGYTTQNIFHYVAVYVCQGSYLTDSSHFSNNSTLVSARPRSLMTFFHKNTKNANSRIFGIERSLLFQHIT